MWGSPPQRHFGDSWPMFAFPTNSGSSFSLSSTGSVGGARLLSRNPHSSAVGRGPHYAHFWDEGTEAERLGICVQGN